MIAMNEEEFNTISEYHVKGIANGENAKIIGKREFVKLEPNLSFVNDSIAALYSPDECLADGFLLGRFKVTFSWMIIVCSSSVTNLFKSHF